MIKKQKPRFTCFNSKVNSTVAAVFTKIPLMQPSADKKFILEWWAYQFNYAFQKFGFTKKSVK